MDSSLGHVPEKSRWEFDASVTECFDDMLARSIPQYEVMRDAVTSIGTWYAEKRLVVDLGCSRGGALAPFADSGHPCLGVEISQPMLAASQFRFEDEIKAGLVEIAEMDLRHDYPEEMASVTLAVLLLQFVPIEYRQQIVRNAYLHTVPGGVMIVVEKILGDSHELNQMMVATYLDRKMARGYTREEIDRKKLSLEGVLVPVTAAMNIGFLLRAGFSQVDCFWRWMNFAAWVAVKE